MSQRLTAPLPAGSLRIPGGIRSSRERDPAEEETRETRRSASTRGAQSGDRLWPGRGRTPKVTFPNGVFRALSCAEKAREMEVYARAKAGTRGHLPGSRRLRRRRWEGDQTPP